MEPEHKPTVAELAEAVRAGDAARARTILEARPELVNMDASANDEHRAIHYAVLRRDAALVRLLMDAGADARKGIYPHRDATSALTIARDRGYDEIVAVIEEKERVRGEELSRSDAAGVAAAQDALHDAIAQGDSERVRDLIEADPAALRETGRDGGLLTLAVKHGRVEMAGLLLDLGADVDERITLEELEKPTPSWGMPLWHAALAGDAEMARLLLDRGADPNANVYASGWPLRNAWHHEDGTVKQLLLERGARLEPYMIAELHDVDEAKRRLRDNGSEELARELAVSAADHGCTEIVKLALPYLAWPVDDARWHWVLIQPIRGAGRDEDNNEGHFASLKLLLEAGINANVARYGATALHFAAGYSGGVGEATRARFAAMLLDGGARVDVRDDLLRSTPLGWACRWGRRELAEVLIRRGATVVEPDAEPWATPAAWARKMKHEEVLHLLQRR